MKKAGGKKGSFSAFGKDLDGNKVAKNFASKADAKSFFPGSFKGMKVKSDKPGFFSSAFGNKQKFGKMKSFKNRSLDRCINTLGLALGWQAAAIWAVTATTSRLS